MILSDFLPGPALREFVQCYRIAHFVFDKMVHGVYKLYPPRPEQCLHFIIRGNESVRFANGTSCVGLPIAILGQQTSVIKRIPENEFLIFQIAFQPGALFKLTGIPASMFTNQYLDARSIFPPNIRFLHEQLQESASYSEMINIINTFLAELVIHTRKDFHLLDFVGKQMLQVPQQFSLDKMAKESCLCTKQFKRKFNERVGVNPKTFARLARFIKTYNFKNKFPKRDWSKIAVGFDYCDYQHLVKDYKEFSGMKPNELHLEETRSPESVLGLSKSVYNIRS